MRLFNFLRRRKRKYETTEQSNDSIYFNLVSKQPMFEDFTGRKLNSPKYNDTYKTGTPFKLRELLLLVWWGNTKSGRKSSVTIPQYFFYSYNLDAQKLTNDFFDKKLLKKQNNKIQLTEKGQQLFNDFYPLWEIHRISNYPMNLDIDFPNWDQSKFDIKHYKQLIDYYKARIEHSEKIIYFLEEKGSTEDDIRRLKYHLSEKDSDLIKIKDLTEKLSILEQKQKIK